VLCLGDGIGDITLALRRTGLEGVYHDLKGSQTAAFARMRLWMYLGDNCEHAETDGWVPELPTGFDAVTAFDFLEHVTDVTAWTAAIHRALKPGGLFFAQNAFAIGSGDQGSIPMHLARNDHFEQDWDPHMAAIGFDRLDSNWYLRR
jgi:SAM-dependent methyltransferase